MALPWLQESPLGGVLGAFTVSIFKLEELFGLVIPIEPLLDFVPGVSPLRVTFDMIDNEQIQHEYVVTDHPLQDVGDATVNVHRRLRKLTVSGKLSAQLAQSPVIPLPLPPIPNPLGILRIDLIRLQNLQNLADQRQPVMVVTPRYSMAKALIESIQREWGPSDGESANCTVTFKEARIIAPTFGAPLSSDFSAQVPGNNAAVGGGQAPSAVSGVSAAPSPVPGGAPVVI